MLCRFRGQAGRKTRQNVAKQQRGRRVQIIARSPLCFYVLINDPAMCLFLLKDESRITDVRENAPARQKAAAYYM
jgi:hypothetical protein